MQKPGYVATLNNLNNSLLFLRQFFKFRSFCENYLLTLVEKNL